MPENFASDARRSARARSLSAGLAAKARRRLRKFENRRWGIEAIKSPRSRCSRLRQQSELQGELYVVRTVRETQLLMDSLLISVHGFRADVKPLADLGSREALCDETKDILLALCELVESLAIDLFGVLFRQVLREDARRRRPDIDVAVRDRSHRIDQLAVSRALHQIPGGTRLHERHEVILLSVHGEHENLRGNALLHDLLRRSGAIEIGHGQVHHHDVRLEALGQRDRLIAVLGLANHLDVLGRAQHRLESGAHDRMVIGQNHSNHVPRHRPSPFVRIIANGITAATVVPFSSLRISNVPSTNDTRSRIVNRPIPGRRRTASSTLKPFPSSLTSILTSSGERSMEISTRRAPE